MNNEMFVAFLKWVATQEPSKGLSRLVNKLWGLWLEGRPGDLEPADLDIDAVLVNLGLAKKSGRGEVATIEYRGVK